MSSEMHTVPGWVSWVAQDANGHWWGYSAEPHQHAQGWYENEVGDCLLLGKEDPNPRWRDTLRRISHTTRT